MPLVKIDQTDTDPRIGFVGKLLDYLPIDIAGLVKAAHFKEEITERIAGIEIVRVGSYDSLQGGNCLFMPAKSFLGFGNKRLNLGRKIHLVLRFSKEIESPAGLA